MCTGCFFFLTVFKNTFEHAYKDFDTVECVRVFLYDLA